MIQVTEEMKDLAKAAATAYITGLKTTDMRDSIERFLDAYDYALKKIWNKQHKDESMREFVNDSFDELE